MYTSGSYLWDIAVHDTMALSWLGLLARSSIYMDGCTIQDSFHSVNAFGKLDILSIGFSYHRQVQRSRIATGSQLLGPSCNFESSQYTPPSSMSFDLYKDKVCAM